VLVVSTDPAHSLGDALAEAGAGTARPLGGEPRAVGGLPEAAAAGELLAAELAAGPAWERWLAPRRPALVALAERGTLLEAEDVARLLELPLPGVDELVGLLELLRLAAESGCSDAVVDTAPTAHTLRLLQMPAALERFAAVLAALQERHRAVAEAFGARAGDPGGDGADAVAAGIEAEARALGERIRDPERCAFAWVLLPEALSLAETRDALAALEAAGATVDELVVNRVTPPPPGPCSACEPRRRAEAAVVRELRETVAAGGGRTIRLVPELADEPRGPVALREVARLLDEGWDPEWEVRGEADPTPDPAPDRDPDRAAPPPWLAAVAPPATRLLLFGGKGGVGKTTCAAAAALAAARAAPERPVLLLSTDPAHSVADVLDATLGDAPRPIPGAPANLRARELDAPAAFAARKERYREALERAFSSLAGGRRSAGFDLPLDRAVLERLLEATPPGLDELVALSELTELTEATGGAGEPLVVVDTAPAGHALRLLELPELALEWDHALLALLLKYRDAVGLPGAWAEELLALARELKGLRALLADPARCRFAAVTRAGELPHRQTRRLVAALERLGIATPVVVVNAVPEGECARCRRGAERSRAEVERLRSELRGRGRPCHILVAPAEYPPPRGVRALERWGRRWSPEAGRRPMNAT
jgi:arsenite-transporting ATPase